MDDVSTYEEAAAKSQHAFAAKDFEAADAYRRRAAELAPAGNRVEQMGDGALQLVPEG